MHTFLLLKKRRPFQTTPFCQSRWLGRLLGLLLGLLSGLGAWAQAPCAGTPSYASVPLLEDFESTWVNACATRDVPASSWRNNPATGNQSWRRDDDGAAASWNVISRGMYSPASNNTGRVTSAHSARFHSYSTLAGATGSLDLYVNLSQAGAKQLRFDYINTDGTDQLEVLFSTDGGQSFSPTPLLTLTTATSWTAQALDLPSSSATGVLRLRATGDYGFTDIGLDNVAVVFRDCQLPTALTATNVAHNAATFSLAAGSGATAFTVTTSPATTTQTFSSAPFTITGLSPTTSYTVAVTSQCGNGQTSPTATTSIRTLCTPPAAYAALPYTQGFEDDWVDRCSTRDQPNAFWLNTPQTGNSAWRRDDDGATAGWDDAGIGRYPYAGSNVGGTTSARSARFHSRDAAGTTGSLDLYVNLSGPGVKQLRFDYINIGNAFYHHDKLEVLLSADGGQSFGATPLLTVTSAGSWTMHAVDLPSTSATSVLRFRATSDYDDFFLRNEFTDIGLDNVMVGFRDCPAPTSLPIPHVTATTATISVVGASGATGYTVTTSPATTTQTFSSAPFTITGLSSHTSYTVAVTSQCAPGQTSPTATTPIRTLCAPPATYAALPYLQGFEANWVGRCGTRELPDAFWVGAPVSGNTSWRRDDDGASAGWSDPSAGMYPYAGSNAGGQSSARSARFHSRRTAGGTSGSLDLYVNLSGPGVKQLRFDYLNLSDFSWGNKDNVEVLLSTDGGHTFGTPLLTLTYFDGWTTRTLDLPSTSATSVIRFRATSNFGYSDIGLDNIMVGYRDCPAPTSLTTMQVTLTSARFAVGGASSYTVTTSPAATHTSSGSTFTLTGLSPNTRYTVSVASRCGNGQTSLPVTTSILTLCPPPATYAAVPYRQDFEASWVNKCATRELPDAFWTSVPVSGRNSWRRDDDGAAAGWDDLGAGMYPHAGSVGSAHSARFHSRRALADTIGILDLYVNLSAAGAKELRFDYMLDTTGTIDRRVRPDQLEVLLSTDGGQNFSSTPLWKTSSINPRWAWQVISLPSSSPTCVLRFRATARNGRTDIGLDNVEVGFRDCQPPSGLQATNVTYNTATFSLAPWATSSAMGYTVTTSPATTTQTFSSAPFTITGLSPNTSYTVLLASQCASGQHSLPFTATIHTRCAPPATYAALPYTQGFEDDWVSRCSTRDQPDAFWLNSPQSGNNSWRRDDDGASANWGFVTAGQYAPTGSNTGGVPSARSARFHSSCTAWDVTSNLDLYVNLSGPGTKRLRFDYINSGGRDQLQVLLSTDGGQTFGAPLLTLGAAGSWTTQAVDLPSTSATSVLRFHITSGFGAVDSGLDNVAVGVRDCAAPTALTTTNVTSTTATFSVAVASGTTGYTVTTSPTTTTRAFSSSSFTLTGLNPNTHYTVLVNSQCGPSQASLPAVANLQTLCAPPATYAALPYVQGFEADWVGRCGTRELPDAFWLGTPLSGNNAWRRDDDGDAAGWSNLTAGSYPLAGSNAGGGSSARSARFHSAMAAAGATGSLDLYVNLSIAGTKQLRFDYINTDGTDQLEVLLSTDGGQSFSPTPLLALTTATSWTAQAVNLPSNSATCVLRFRGITGLSETTDIGLDNVAVVFPGCPAPTLTTTNVMATSATFSVVGASGATGFTVTTSPATTTRTFSSAPFTITGLSPNTGYTVTLTSQCAPGQHSLPVTTSIQTLCSPPATYATLPYMQGFEADWVSRCGIRELPDAFWVSAPLSGNSAWRHDNDGDAAGWSAPGFYMYAPAGSSAGGQSSARSARFHSSWAAAGSTSSLDLYVNLSPAGAKQLRFDYINSNGTDRLEVLLSTDGGQSFGTPLRTLTTASAWTMQVMDLPTTSATCVLRFRATADNAISDIGLDNVLVEFRDCPAPTNLTADNVAHNAATISAAGASGATGFTVTTSPATTTQTFSSTPFTITGLSPNTGYTVTVSSQCSSGQASPSVTTALLTLCAPPATYAALPYVQGFEADWVNRCSTRDQPDAFWLNTPQSGNNSWRRDDDGAAAAWRDAASGVYAPTGSNAGGTTSARSARFHTQWASRTMPSSLDLYVDLSGTGTKQLRLDYINPSTWAQLEVLLSTDGGQSFGTPLLALTNASSWTTRAVDLSSTSATCVLRFRATSSNISPDIGLDNVLVEYKDCLAPTVLAVSNLASNSATFSVPGASGATGFTVTTSPATTTQTFSSAPFTITGLSPSTSYTVSVSSQCSNGQTSPTAATISVQTLCAAPTTYAALPYTQGFEADWVGRCGTRELPDAFWLSSPLSGNSAWRRDNDGGAAGWTTPTSGVYAPTGSNMGGTASARSARFHTQSAPTGATGSLDLFVNLSGAGAKQLRFDYINPSGLDRLEVLLSTNGGQTFGAPLLTLTTPGSWSWTTQVVDLPGTSATSVLRFRATSDNAPSDIGLDNVLVGFRDCPAPTTLTATNVTHNAATFSLAGASGATSYTVTTSPATTTRTLSSSTFTLTGLSPSTNYTVLVSSQCGNGQTSPAITAAIQTRCTPPATYAALPLTETFENLWANSCATQDVPGSSWYATPSTGDNAWRRSDDNTTAGWTLAPGGMYAPAGSNAVGAASTRSARFHSFRAPGNSTGSLDLYVNLSGTGTPELVFDYINETDTDKLDVLLSTDGGLSFASTPLLTLTMTAGWTRHLLTFSGASATSVIRFRATGIAGTGNGFSDIGLDNVGVRLTACLPPTALTVTGTTLTSASFSFAEAGGVAGYTVTTSPATTTQTVSGSPFTITGLSPGTSYTVLLSSQCGGQTSTAAMATAITQCPPPAAYAALPYTQNFETAWINKCSTRDQPDAFWLSTPFSGNSAWRRDNDGAAAGWSSVNFGSYTPAGSSMGGANSLRSARFHSFMAPDNSSGSLDLYVNLSTAGPKELRFDYINPTGADGLEVLLSTDGGQTFGTPLLALTTAGSWTTHVLNLPSSPATGVLRFRATADNATSDIGLDNVLVQAPPVTDVSITALVAPAAIDCYQTTQAITVTIRNYGTADVSNVPVEVAISGALTQTLTGTCGGTIAAGSTLDFTLPTPINMTVAGNYTFNATTRMPGDGVPANDALAPQVRTASALAAMPYSQNFDAGTTLPTGWSTAGTFGAAAVMASHGQAGSNALAMRLFSSSASIVATMPLLGPATVASPLLRFDARFVDNLGYPSTGTAFGAGDKVDVQVSVCNGPMTTVYTINSSNYNGNGQPGTGFYTYSVPLASVAAGQQVRVRFAAATTGGDYYFDLDNVLLIDPAIDLMPTALSSPVSNPGQCGSSNEALTIEVRNNGTAALDFASNNATITAEVTPPSGAANRQTFSATLTAGTLAVGSTQSVTLNGTLGITATGTYTFVIRATTANEGNLSNDVLNRSISRTVVGVAQGALPFSQSFEASTSIPPGWIRSGSSVNVMPGHGTGGSNGLSMALSGTTASGIIITPRVGPAPSASPVLRFDARFVDNAGYPGTATTLGTGDKVDVQVAVCGGPMTTVYTINSSSYNGTGQPGTGFYTYSVPLPGVGAGQQVQVRFQATRANGDYYFDLDNVHLESPPPTDAGVVTLVEPAMPMAAGLQNVAVQVKNHGLATLNTATVNWTVNGVAQPAAVLTGLNLAPGATSTAQPLGIYNFSGAALSYTIIATTSQPNGTPDANPANDAFTRTVSPALNGTYPVGNGQQFPSITAAVNLLNEAGVGGPVTFALTDASYDAGETFPIVINAVPGSSATNTVALQPAAGVTARITGSSAEAIIKLNGADHVILDGANNASATRQLTLTNTSTAANSLVVWLASVTATDGATHNSVRNLNIVGSGTSTQSGIGLLGAATTLPGQNHDGNTLSNNHLLSLGIGLNAVATATEAYDNLVITGNSVGPAAGAPAAEHLLRAGIVVARAPGVRIERNTVQNVVSSDNTAYGISLGQHSAGAVLERNTVRNIHATGTAGYGARGLSIAPGPTGTGITVRNNAISAIVADGNGASPLFGIMGIGIFNGTGYTLHNNSVQVSGSRPANLFSDQVSAALWVDSAATALDVRNNVLSNVQATANAASPGTNYAVYAPTSAPPFRLSNYNLYDVRSTAPQFIGRLGTSSAGNQPTLAAWQAATGADASSLAANPGFTSLTDLTPQAADANSWHLNGTGVQLAALNHDLPGAARPTTVATGAPDLGAYEFTPTAQPNALTTTGALAPGSTQEFFFAGRRVARLTYGATGTLPTTLVARYYPGTLPPAAPAITRHQHAYLDLAATGGTDYTADLTLDYDEALLGTVATASTQRLVQRRPDGSYMSFSQSTADATARTITAPGLTSFGQFFGTDQPAPLPVGLTSFAAQRQGADAVLSWTTAQEQHSRGFEVQVSSDGRHYRALGFVASATPNASAPRHYRFVDGAAGKQGTRYYRLRQLDLDGAEVFFGPRAVAFDTPTQLTATGWPNPFSQHVTVEVVSPQAGAAEVQVLDALGRVVLRQSAQLQAGAQQLPLSGGQALPAGTYLLRLTTAHQTRYLRLVKE